jgi:hypothetical protein
VPQFACSALSEFRRRRTHFAKRLLSTSGQQTERQAVRILYWSESVFCVKGGTPNPDGVKCCHECGNRLASTRSELVSPPIRTEKDLLLEILSIDRKPNECHGCGADTDLTRHQFAIAKVLSVKREWGETLARAGLSAVSIVTAPLTGFGMLSWQRPGKTTSYQLLPAELVLCRSCLSWAWKTRHGTELKDEAYRFHPWAEKARSIGYCEYLSSERIEALKPIK